MTFGYRYRKYILIGVFIFIVIGSIIGLVIYKVRSKPKREENVSFVSKKVKKEEENEKEEDVLDTYMVDIKGEVVVPGIYSFSTDARVIDVIEKAGGLSENADTSVLNLSKKVWDEMVIIIYSKEEVNDFKRVKELEQQVQNYCIQKDSNAVVNDACIDEEEIITGKISINSGSVEELMKLKGIGEAKAKDIISYREKNGPFQTIEEIMNVPGIGESRFAAIQEDITV